jgi:hypothetical protein
MTLKQRRMESEYPIAKPTLRVEYQKKKKYVY